MPLKLRSLLPGRRTAAPAGTGATPAARASGPAAHAGAAPGLPPPARTSAPAGGSSAPRAGLDRLQAALHRPAAEPADEASGPAAKPGIGARAKQLVQTKRVLHEPAVRFDGDWQATAAAEICAAYAAERDAHRADGLSLPALGRLRALEFERKHGDTLPAGERLLPPGTSKAAYHDAELRAFLEAIGEDDPERVLASFAKTGTGALHRVNVSAASTASAAVGVAQSLVPEPATKAALTGVRLALQGVTAATVFDSGGKRLRTSGAENLMALVRADAPPGAKSGPDIFSASNAVLGDLHGVRKTLDRMHAAMAALDAAVERQAADDTPQARRAVERAREDLDIAFARHCLQAETKARYKGASESGKVEWRGSQRNLVMNSYIGGSAGIAAGILALMTPALVAAPVSAGASAGAAGLALGLYLAYQLGAGPSKDGEAKARRAFVALGKSGDILGGNAARMQQQRASAYAGYVEARKGARWHAPGERARRQDAAREALVARLREIAAGDELQPEFDGRENWQAVVGHERAKADAGDPAADPRAAARHAELDAAFTAAHEAKFDRATIAGAIRTPLAIRFDDATKLCAGKVAHAQRKLLEFDEDAARGRLHKPGWEARRASAREALAATLKAHVADSLNLAVALARVQAGDARAGAALAAVGDVDVHALFCGDGRAQVDAEDKAKRLTAGELERYVFTIGGAGVAGIVAGNVGAIGDLARNVGVAADLPHASASLAPAWKSEALVAQTSGPLTSQHSASDRTPFMKTAMPPILAPLARKGDPIEFALALPAGAHDAVDPRDAATDAALDGLVARMSAAAGVADRVRVQGEGMPAVAVGLGATADYYKRQYDTASARDKARFQLRQGREIAGEVGTSLVANVWQAAAQVPLARTRAPLERAHRLAPEVRRRLIDAERRDAATTQAPPRIDIDAPPPADTPAPSEPALDAAFARDFAYLAPMLGDEPPVDA